MPDPLTDQDKILLKLAALCVEPLPKDFLNTEVNNRVWSAFELGKLWKEIDAQHPNP